MTFIVSEISIMCIHDGEVLYFRYWFFLKELLSKLTFIETVKEKLILDLQGKWCYMYDFYHS